MQLKRLTTFAGVGATGVPVDLAVTWFVMQATGVLPAQVGGWAVAATWNWWWNRTITWESDAPPLREWAAYLGIDVGRLAVRLAVVAAIVAHVPDFVATVAGIGTAALLGFVGFDQVLFGDGGVAALADRVVAD